MSTSDDGGWVSDVAAEAAGSLLPFGGSVLAGPLVSQVRAEWGRNASVALRAAEAVSGRSREQLEAEIADDPALHPLLVRLLQAAGMNGHDPTLAAMGTALGQAVRDRNRLDEAALVLAAISGMGASHALLLRHLCFEGPPDGAWPVGAFLNSAHELPAEIRPLVYSALLGAGLLEFDGLYVAATPLGRVVLKMLVERNAAQ